MNSCGCALYLALRAAGVAPGDAVLVKAFPLAPVPSAIAHTGARPALVDIPEDLTIDLDDLRAKARGSSARYLILSHMRGYAREMDAVAENRAADGITLIEDSAHTPGARWNGRLTSRFGLAGCFSAQSDKHLNGSESRLIVTDDAGLAPRMILMSSAYTLYAQHRARPELEVFDW